MNVHKRSRRAWLVGAAAPVLTCLWLMAAAPVRAEAPGTAGAGLSREERRTLTLQLLVAQDLRGRLLEERAELPSVKARIDVTREILAADRQIASLQEKLGLRADEPQTAPDQKEPKVVPPDKAKKQPGPGADKPGGKKPGEKGKKN